MADRELTRQDKLAVIFLFYALLVIILSCLIWTVI